MEHIRILLTIVGLVTGTGAMVYAVQFIKLHTYPFLKPLVTHIISYNICLLVLLFAKYADVNMPGQFPFSDSPLYAETGLFLISLLSFIMSYCMLKIYTGFRDKPVPPLYRGTYIFLAILVLFSLAMAKLLPAQSPAVTIFDNIHESLIDIIFLLELVWLLAIRFGDRKNPDKDKKKTTGIFAYLYLSRYVVVILIVVIPGTARYYLIMAGMIYFNIVPILWLRWVFLPYTRDAAKIPWNEITLESVCQNFNISKREQEILALVLKGKSNKEIEEALYISIHTVKNHIYNIYKKLDVKNRYQLMHLFTK